MVKISECETKHGCDNRACACHDRRNNQPEGYDEYARKPKDQRRYTDPQDASISYDAETHARHLDGSYSDPQVSTKLANELARQGWALEIGEHTEADKAARRSPAMTLWIQQPEKPRVRLHTFIGGHTKAEYSRVLFAHADARMSSVQWKTTAKDAWEDFATRTRLGQP